MREGSLREDLFFRLSTVILFIPPLSERMEDLEPLIQGFIEKGNRRYRTSVTGLDPRLPHLVGTILVAGQCAGIGASDRIHDEYE